MKKITFNINGMHCASCKTLIESEVSGLKGVDKIEIDYVTGEAIAEFDEQQITDKEIFVSIQKLNYAPGYEKNNKRSSNSTSVKKVITALVLVIIFILGFYLIEHFGLFEILSSLNQTHISYSLIFIIGILAGFHCVGMCGGFVISYTARHQLDNESRKASISPHIQYNMGRVISYTIIGGLLGAFGSVFTISSNFSGIVLLIAGIFMVLMGLSFFKNFSWLEKIKLRTPDFIARYIFKQRKDSKPKAPLIIGLLTGFMPCGPLQAMQLYALTTGSPLRGALSMGIYAIGTVPLMFGLGSFMSILSGGFVKRSLKISGAIVILLGLFTFSRGLGNFGINLSLAGMFSDNTGKVYKFDDTQAIDTNNGNYQEVRMEVTPGGYEPSAISVKKGVPVKWIIDVKSAGQMTGCNNSIILYGYNIEKNLQIGENTITFTPKDSGDIKFSCGMRMLWGKFVVN